MQRSDFYFDLPEALIAQFPLEERTASRLLCLERKNGAVQDRHFSDILSLLNSGDLLVFNDTRVIPARLFASKETGGRVEILVERILGPQHCLAHVRASKSPKPGTFLLLKDAQPEFTSIKVTGRHGDLFELEVQHGVNLLAVLEAHGHIPLPPYIDREDSGMDHERYQTVYAKHKGAVAAPTAGLHFSEDLLQALAEKQIDFAHVTLHVGAGTFQPVRVDDITQHTMHSEVMHVSQAVCDTILRTKRDGGRVIAVGTTAVRCLETVARLDDTCVSGDGELPQLREFSGETDIFIYPGYKFRIVDAMITNFHLPESTLLMLVSAFAGYEHTMSAYRHAVENHYRFFSYGDAMFIA